MVGRDELDWIDRNGGGLLDEGIPSPSVDARTAEAITLGKPPILGCAVKTAEASLYNRPAEVRAVYARLRQRGYAIPDAVAGALVWVPCYERCPLSLPDLTRWVLLRAEANRVLRGRMQSQLRKTKRMVARRS